MRDAHHDLRDEIEATVERRAKARQLVDRLTERLKRLRKRARKIEARPHVVVERNVCNQSSRGGTKPRLIVLHSTESPPQRGHADLEAIAAYFDSPSAQASSHVITDPDGDSARCVPDSEKAWTQAAFNSVSLSIEQIGYASQKVWDERQVAESARWVARWSKEHGIPIKRGAVLGYAVTRSGVVTHADLGAPGGGHADPGSAYPIDHLLELARDFRKAL